MLRHYAINDYAIVKSLLKGYYAKVKSKFKEDFLKKELQRLSDKDVLMVVEVKKKVAGLVWVYCRDRKGRIKYLIVEKKHQGKGHGTKLMQWAMQWFKENKLQRIDLKVEKDNASAIKLYEKFGFSVEKYLMVKGS